MFEKISETVVKGVQSIIDDYVAFIVITASIVMAYNQIALQDWQIAAVGMVLAYYFK